MEEIIKKETMTSIEIAEVAGRNHKDVMRSIREMEDAWVKVNGRKFALVEYKDAKGEMRPCYALTKTECLYIATKFNDEARAKLILRWEELETGKTASRYISNKEDEVRAGMAWVEGMKNLFNLSNAATLNLTKKVAAPLNLPVPEEIKSEGALLSAKDLLKKYTIGMSSQAFNKLAESNGYLETIYRTDSKGKQKSFKTITKKGLEFGENRNDERNLSETQPKWYVDKFQELLIKLGLA
mgnify:CR=1 FL=1